MTSQRQSPPTLLFVIAGLCVLLLIGSYMLWRAPSNNTPTDVQSSQTASNAAGMSDADRKATEAVVRAYILENPEIIPEAVEILQKREIAKRLTAAGSTVTRPFPGAEAGNPNGDITIVEFTDYNCGFCRASVADVQRLLKSDGNIRLIYRELPILSQSSRDAALWALAAAKQGKHKAFHDALFAGGRANEGTIMAAARSAGLDLAAAQKFAGSAEAAQEVERNLAMMQQLGFNGTPTFIIGDQILEGALGYDALKAAVEKARKKA